MFNLSDLIILMMGVSVGYGYFDVLSICSVVFSVNSGVMLNGDMWVNGWQQQCDVRQQCELVWFGM